MIEFFFDLCYMLPLELVLGLNILNYAGLQEFNTIGSIAGALTVIFICFIMHTGKTERFLLLGIVTVLFGGLAWALGREKRAELFAGYSFLLWIIGAAILCMLIGRLAEKYLWMKAVVAAALIANNVYLMINCISISGAAVAGSFLIVMIYVAALMQTRWKKTGYTDIKAHIALITPVMLLVFLLVWVVPAPSKTLDWTFAKNIWNAIVTEWKRVSSAFDGGRDDFANTGFSEASSFDEGVGKTPKDVMVISIDGTVPDRLYLGGVIYEDFSPKGWTSDLESTANSRYFDLLETRAAIIKFTDGREHNFIKNGTITLQSRMSNTKHIFLPSKVNLDSEKTVLPNYRETEVSVMSDAKLRYGDSYSVSWFCLNYTTPQFETLINTAVRPTIEEWNALIRSAATPDREAFSYENYLSYTEMIYEKYGSVQGMSEDVTRLVNQLLEGVEGDYNRVMALADYLKTLEYNTHPGSIPETVTNATEYLDYFLLQSRKGYCVHYATAMVLLARECGYPARYVQGYCVNTNGDSRNIVVNEANAHSWAEVYFDNFGWIKIEATPGFSLPTGWAAYDLINSGLPTGYSQNNQSGERPVSEEPIEPEEAVVKKTFPVRYVVIPLSLAVFFGAIYLFVNAIITESKYKKMNNEQKVRFIVRRMLRIYRILGYPIGATETIEEYKTRITEDLSKEQMMPVFFTLYEQLLYADIQVSDMDVSHMETEYKELKHLFRKQGFWYRFYIV